MPPRSGKRFAATGRRPDGHERIKDVAPQGALVRHETQGDWAHFFLATYWDSLRAIKAFAGDDYQVAVTYPDDEQFELLSDPYVFHHNVQDITPL